MERSLRFPQASWQLGDHARGYAHVAYVVTAMGSPLLRISSGSSTATASLSVRPPGSRTTSTADAEYGGVSLISIACQFMDAWLRSAPDAVAAATGVPVGELELTPGDEQILLDLARAAAHNSGERTNAPLLCYLVGLAVAKSGTELDKIAIAVG